MNKRQIVYSFLVALVLTILSIFLHDQPIAAPHTLTFHLALPNETGARLDGAGPSWNGRKRAEKSMTIRHRP